ncbi:MAG: substrate-binding domain-containing protein [Thermoflexales bacterium]
MLTEYGATYSRTVVAHEQDVKAVVRKVMLGEAITIPDAHNTIAIYPIAALNDTKQAALAAAFVDFALSPASQAVPAKYGFVSAPFFGRGARISFAEVDPRFEQSAIV